MHTFVVGQEVRVKSSIYFEFGSVVEVTPSTQIAGMT